LLPPDKLVKRTKEGRLYYVYADAACSNCAYVGTPQAYAAYQNWGNDQNYGSGDQQSNAMQTIEGDDDADIAPSIDSILGPNF
jgi:phage gpG-like protein